MPAQTLSEVEEGPQVVGLKKESELLSEANTQLTRSQTKKQDETRSNKSNDRYSRVSSSRYSRQPLGLKKERKSVNAISRKQPPSLASQLSGLKSTTQEANAIGEVMQDNLFEETGKLGMHWVAHDKLID